MKLPHTVSKLSAVTGRLLPGLAKAVLLVFALLLVAYLFVIRPWALRWGATDEEISRAMTGDWIVPRPTFNATRAVEINARPDQIWPWIVQMGTGRAGFYSYDWIDNRGVASAERIITELQHPQAGDPIPTPSDGRGGFRVKGFEPNRYMLWLATDTRTTWCWGLYPTGRNRTRLVTRIRFRHPWVSPAIVGALLADVGDIVMMRKCMLGIKARAEALAKREAVVRSRLSAEVGARPAVPILPVASPPATNPSS